MRRYRRRRTVNVPGKPFLLAKLIRERRYSPHTCRSCGDDMVEQAGGFWWCKSCAETGPARRRRAYIGSSIGDAA